MATPFPMTTGFDLSRNALKMPKLPDLSLPALSGGMRTSREKDDDLPLLTPQDEEQLIEKLGRGIVGGIGAVGSALDVPAALVRNVLGDKDPIDVLRHPLSYTGRQTGRDLLTKLGAPENVEGFDWGDLGWDIAGFVTEIALDPLTYLTLGTHALFKTGKALTATNAMDDLVISATKKLGRKVGKREALLTMNLDEVVKYAPNSLQEGLQQGFEKYFDRLGIPYDMVKNEKLGSVVGFKIPFVDAQLHFGAQGNKVAEWWARNVFDRPAGAIMETKLGRSLRAMFDHKVQGVTSSVRAQQYAASGWREAERLKALGRMDRVDRVWDIMANGLVEPESLARHIPGMDLEAAKTLSLQIKRGMRRYWENVEGATHIGPQSIPYVAQTLDPELRQTIDGLRTHLDQMLDAEKLEGIAVDALTDSANIRYLYRDRHYFPGDVSLKQKSGVVGALLSPKKQPFQFKRDLGLKGIAQGTDALNQISLDRTVSGFRYRFSEIPEFKGRAWTDDMYNYVEGHIRNAYSDLLGPQANYHAIAKVIANIDPRHADEMIPMYNIDPIASYMIRGEQSDQALAAVRNTHRFIADNARPARYPAVKDSPGWASDSVFREADTLAEQHPITVNEFYRAVNGLHNGEAPKRFLDEYFGDVVKYLDDPTSVAEPPLWKRDMYAELMAGGGHWRDEGQLQRWAKSVVIPREVSSEARRFVKMFMEPDSAKPIVDAYDAATRVWKGAVTIFWPSFHMRNLMSGFTRNWAAGVLDIGTVKDSAGLIAGKGIRDAVEKYGYSTKEIQQMLFAHRVIEHHTGMAGEVLMTANRQVGTIPGVSKILAQEPAGLVTGPRNAWKRYAPVEGSILSRYGGSASYAVEGLNRISPFLAYLKKGYTPEAAAKMVDALQVNYSHLTDVERKVFRRVWPFWAFHKGVVPWTVKELAERPGGRLSMIPKATSRARVEDPIVPEEAQGSAAVKIPGGPEGGARYLSTYGLMEEPFYAMVAPLLGAARQPMTGGGEFFRELMSQTNPAIKAILEVGTGRSTFFEAGEPGGRELRSLNPPIGQALENIRTTITGDVRKAVPVGTNVLDMVGASEAVKEIPRAFEYAIGASPFSRVVSTVRQSFDPRKKWWEKLMNTLTGAKVITVSPERIAAIRSEALDNAMREVHGSTQFSIVGIPEDALAVLPPHLRQHAQRLKALRSKWNADRRAQIEAEKRRQKLPTP